MQAILRFYEKLFSILGHFFVPFLCCPKPLFHAEQELFPHSATCCRNLFPIYMGFFTVSVCIFICCQLLIAVSSVRNKDDRLESEGRHQEIKIIQEVVGGKVFGHNYFMIKRIQQQIPPLRA